MPAAMFYLEACNPSRSAVDVASRLLASDNLIERVSNPEFTSFGVGANFDDGFCVNVVFD